MIFREWMRLGALEEQMRFGPTDAVYAPLTDV